MSYMKIKNPTKESVSINYKGTIYRVEPGRSETLPEDVIQHWIKIHGFMVVDTETEKVVDEVVVVPAVDKVKEKKK